MKEPQRTQQDLRGNRLPPVRSAQLMHRRSGCGEWRYGAKVKGEWVRRKGGGGGWGGKWEAMVQEKRAGGGAGERTRCERQQGEKGREMTVATLGASWVLKGREMTVATLEASWVLQGREMTGVTLGASWALSGVVQRAAATHL